MISASVIGSVGIWTAVGINVWGCWLSHKARKGYLAATKRLDDEIDSIRSTGLPHGAVENVHREAMRYIGLDTDLLERAHTDLVFLHDQLYRTTDQPATNHACPICESTIQDIERMAAKVRSVRMEFEAHDNRENKKDREQ